MNKIEKLSRMRRNTLISVFVGSAIIFVLYLIPAVFSWFHFQTKFALEKPILLGSGILGIFILLIFMIRFWLYKKSLKKDPSLRTAVNDERVKINWLKAYRIAFFVVVFIHIFWKALEMIWFMWSIPHPTWIIIPASVMFLVGSFLYYNKETKDE